MGNTRYHASAKVGLALLWLGLIFTTWGVGVVHLAVFPHAPLPVDPNAKATWLENGGLHHLVLEGSSYGRGRAAAEKTFQLVTEQERILVERFEEVLPNPIFRSAFVLALMRWFWGVDRYLEDWMTDEMQGIADYGTTQFNRYADPMTRQVAYHGLHEVGQFFVDRGGEGMGCTVLLIPTARGWAIGRNFDFEGGRIFDDEKIVKWVFPDRGLSFVSVIWAGMVGAVTGVNEKGVYLSLNAAGSKDFRRYGTPSTLVALKALQFAESAEQAKQIIEDATMFITDIFVVSDGRSAYVIEKSPRRHDARQLTEATAVANHLNSPLWKEDGSNQFRRDELTSGAREARGQELLGKLPAGRPIETILARYLRDKKALGGKKLHLGNRAAIDALIATHAVIYVSGTHRLYVSQGPSLAGPFRGYDLKRSFATRRPVEAGLIGADPQVNWKTHADLVSDLAALGKAQKLLQKKNCTGAFSAWSVIRPREHVAYYSVKGDILSCLGDEAGAKIAYRTALNLEPAYASERARLKEKVEP